MDRNSPSPLARIARTLTNPRSGVTLLLAVALCIGTIVHLAAADVLDPTKPSASFTVSSSTPLTDEPVTFPSPSTAGLLGAPIQSEAWDLNNDGNFDDGTGSEASRSFPAAGTYTVKLLVTDQNGATDVATADVKVQKRVQSASVTLSTS